MNFFEQELRKLFGDGAVIQSPSFSGRACLGTLGNDLRVKAEFVTTGVHDHYSALRVRVISRKSDQEIDSLLIRFLDVWGKPKIPGNPYLRDGVEPHIWVDRGETEWYAWRPAEKDFDALRRQVRDFLEVYRDQSRERKRETAKVVYLCAPLRGDVKANNEFVRQQANEELEAGNIPVCPHFLLPTSVRLNQTKQAEKAKEMGMRMLEACQEVHVCGDQRTDRMREEIRRAEELGIPVVTDQWILGRSAPHEQTPGKRKKSGPSR